MFLPLRKRGEVGRRDDDRSRRRRAASCLIQPRPDVRQVEDHERRGRRTILVERPPRRLPARDVVVASSVAGAVNRRQLVGAAWSSAGRAGRRRGGRADIRASATPCSGSWLKSRPAVPNGRSRSTITALVCMSLGSAPGEVVRDGRGADAARAPTTATSWPTKGAAGSAIERGDRADQLQRLERRRRDIRSRPRRISSR